MPCFVKGRKLPPAIILLALLVLASAPRPEEIDRLVDGLHKVKQNLG